MFTSCQRDPNAALAGRLVCTLEDGHEDECCPRKAPRGLEAIMTRPGVRAEKEGVVGFVQGTALVNGIPVLPPELAGKRIRMTIEVFDE